MDRHVPQDHLLRSIDRFVGLGSIRRHLAPFYSRAERLSVYCEPGTIAPRFRGRGAEEANWPLP
ncbi:hypothetical protein DDZ14_14330 [Maritimibacter sp. 55A14]|nr:hypothetical protein DDZ14_14330 [Maritimibacter sp. 55A14]